VIDAVLPLAAAKAHVRVLDNDSDTLIAALSGAAIDAVQQYTGKRLTQQTVIWRGDFADAMPMGVGPVTEITTVKYWNSAGVEVTLAPAGVLILSGDRIEAAPSLGGWPATDGRSDAVTITLKAGYTDPATECASLIAAAKLLLGHLFINRESVVTGMTAIETPMGFEALCAPYRDIRI
jgi:uncharacterized phiE125 gp8 family phage protein